MSAEKRGGQPKGSRISLYPLTFEEALKALLDTPPERKEPRPAPPDKNGSHPKD